jgi:hypothetical protein
MPSSSKCKVSSLAFAGGLHWWWTAAARLDFFYRAAAVAAAAVQERTKEQIYSSDC